jgi:hypothetical protein
MSHFFILMNLLHLGITILCLLSMKLLLVLLTFLDWGPGMSLNLVCPTQMFSFFVTFQSAFQIARFSLPILFLAPSSGWQALLYEGSFPFLNIEIFMGQSAGLSLGAKATSLSSAHSEKDLWFRAQSAAVAPFMTLKPPSLSRERRGMDQKLASSWPALHLWHLWSFWCVLEIGL